MFKLVFSKSWNVLRPLNDPSKFTSDHNFTISSSDKVVITFSLTMDWKQWLNGTFQNHLHENNEILTAARETQGGRNDRTETENRKESTSQGNL